MSKTDPLSLENTTTSKGHPLLLYIPFAVLGGVLTYLKTSSYLEISWIWVLMPFILYPLFILGVFVCVIIYNMKNTSVQKESEEPENLVPRPPEFMDRAHSVWRNSKKDS